jgi:surfeit locus 1 family protein
MKNDYSTDPSPAAAGSPLPEVDVRWQAGSIRARLLWFVVAALCATGTFYAGLWQLSRGHKKTALAALVAERGKLGPMPAGELARDPATAERQFQRHVELTGEWVTAHTVFLMNRTMDERSGFYVMTPLRLPDGSTVIVQRGWIPRDDANPMKVPALPMRGGPVRVFGHAAPWPDHWIDIGHSVDGPVRQNIELAAFTTESGLVLRPLTVVEDATPENALDGMRRDWPTAVGGVSVATNYGYAVQWFAMSIAFFGLYAWLQFIRPHKMATSESPGAAPVDDPTPR